MKYSFAIAALFAILTIDSTSAVVLSQNADPKVDDIVKDAEAKATKSPEDEKKAEEEKKAAEAEKAKAEAEAKKE